LRNNFEKRIYKELNKYKVPVEYEPERIPYTSYYIPDFVVFSKKTKKKIYIETKGYLRPEDKTKLRAVKKQYPDMDIRIVFYESRKKSLKWAEKNKFPYSIHSVPKEWLDE